MAQHVSDPPYLGDFKEDETVHFIWNTFDDNNASVTRSTNGTVSVYKDNGVTQSVAGITDTEGFDSLTGIHACTIDLSADAFYASGANYTVVVSAMTVAGDVINAALAHFSIENRAPILAIGAPSAIDSGTATLAGMLLKMIDDNAGADFDATTDSLEKIKNSVGTPVALDGGSATLAAMLAKMADDNGGASFDATTDSLRQQVTNRVIRTNTAQAGAAGTITLDASASATNDFYKDCVVYIRSGTGSGQHRLINAYNGTSKVATIAPDWKTNPDNTSVFDVIPGHAAIIAGLVDTVTIEYILKIVKAMANGKYEIDTPGTGDITFYEEDGTTVLTVVNVTTAGRTKTS